MTEEGRVSGEGKVSASRVFTVTSRSNPSFKALRRLCVSARERKKRGHCLVEGERLVEAALRVTGPPQAFVVSLSGLERASVARTVAEHRGARLIVLPDGLLKELTSLATPPALSAVVPLPPSPEEPPGGDRLLLDGIQDPGNLGTILRSAAAAGGVTVLLSSSCADPWSPKTLRAGMGAHFHVALKTGVDLPQAARGFDGDVVVLAHDAGASLFETDLTRPVAFIVGGEGQGVSPDLRRAARRRVRIPMPGWEEPLNAAAAATLCLFERVRQRLERGV